MDCHFLTTTLIFQGISPEEIQTMLPCLDAEQKSYQKGDSIFREGEQISAMGLVLSGSVSIENHDIWGNKSILDHVGKGQVFAETYACVPKEPLMVSVVAAEATEVLFLHTERLLTVCSNACSHHSKIIRNLLSISSQKNLSLSRRIFHTSAKSIRGRLLSYLSYQAIRHGNREFDIPFQRQQLADYLSVDRSALSHELSKMQKDGLLQTKRNHFILLKEIEDIF